MHRGIANDRIEVDWMISAKMHPPYIREASSQLCFSGCCPSLGILEPQTPTSLTTAAASRYEFEVAMVSSFDPDSQFTNHESLPLLQESFFDFVKVFPQYSQTDQADKIREQEYYHLSLFNHVCLDYIGHGLFSYSQQQSHSPAGLSASTSSSSCPSQHFTALEPPFFDISYKSVNFNSQILFGGEESELEKNIRKRIMAFMNISEVDYTMIFTANQSSAFRILSDTYPFQSNQNLLTVYDYESEAVKLMVESSKKRGARVMSAEFSWPNLRIQSEKLRKKITSKRKNKKRGLFVFPLQSRVTGARYSYTWMSTAQENGWHVLLDACALGPKDMETLGLSLFKPDFLICSFFKVFGENPSGFACLFVKKSTASDLKDSTITNISVARLVPAVRPFEESSLANADTEPDQNAKIESQKAEAMSITQKAPEIEQLVTPSHSKMNVSSELECRGLDHADILGLILISSRERYLINWLVNALMSLKHPNTEQGVPPVRIYGPKIKFDRGPTVAFNVFDWKGEKIDPVLVQKLASRYNISLSCGILQHIWFSNKNEEERQHSLETRTSGVLVDKRDQVCSGFSVVTAALGFLTNFEDIYRLWTFVSRFLDADFVEKEKWRYKSLNQKTVEV